MTSKTEKQLLELTKELNKLLDNTISDDERINDIVSTMKSIPITVEILRVTKTGLVLQQVKKKLNKDSQTFHNVKELIVSWKQQCNNQLNNKNENKRVRKPVVRYETVSNEEEINRKITKIGAITIYPDRQPIPSKDKNGYLVFPDYPHFKPNLTPKEVMQMGSFGGTYFRIISSKITNETYKEVWKEFPADWFEGLSIPRQVSSQTYSNSVNKYNCKCGGDLDMWESSGWITAVDPYGWFQWYCRFYLGRRCSDDERQISRALGVMGSKGRWRNTLINKLIASNKKPKEALQDYNISPKIRQLLQHWGYSLTEADLLSAMKKK